MRIPIIIIILGWLFFQCKTKNPIPAQPFISKEISENITSILKENPFTQTFYLRIDTLNYVYELNEIRAHQEFPVASTFKIPNTLIALQENILTDSTQYQWDGVERMLPAWNQNQNIYTAYKNSTVWFYQKIASQLTLPIYQKYLKEMQYGNQETGTELTQFWLNGALRISAKEQVDFLMKLDKEQLPFSPLNFEIGKKIMTEYSNDSLRLIAKTGLSFSEDSLSSDNVAWYVGYVKKKNAPTLYFAYNYFCNSMEDRKYRKDIVFKILYKLGYYPPSPTL